MGLQKSILSARFQAAPASSALRKGAGRGLWQMRIDDVSRLLTTNSTKERSEAISNKYVGAVHPHAVWATLEYNDVLAALFARLMLWPDPAALPAPAAANERAALLRELWSRFCLIFCKTYIIIVIYEQPTKLWGRK